MAHFGLLASFKQYLAWFVDHLYPLENHGFVQTNTPSPLRVTSDKKEKGLRMQSVPVGKLKFVGTEVHMLWNYC